MTAKQRRLRRRIERLYREAEDTESSRGAFAWFARAAGLTRRSVSRWFEDNGAEPSDRSLRILELLEDRHGLGEG